MIALLEQLALMVVLSAVVKVLVGLAAPEAKRNDWANALLTAGLMGAVALAVAFWFEAGWTATLAIFAAQAVPAILVYRLPLGKGLKLGLLLSVARIFLGWATKLAFLGTLPWLIAAVVLGLLAVYVVGRFRRR